MPSFSILVPTIGRLTLGATLESLRCQLTPQDEVIVIGDGEQPDAAKLFAGAGLCGWYIQTRHEQHDHGNSQRNYGMERARGDYLLFLDDDDIYLPGALDRFREVLTQHPDHIPVFRFRYPDGRLVWGEPGLHCGNVGSAIFAVPNDRQRLPAWGTRYEADFDFLETCSKVWAIDWHDAVVCQVRPHEVTPK